MSTEIPVRCFTCGHPITKWILYMKNLPLNNYDKDKTLALLKIVAPCCKKMYSTHIDLLTKSLRMKDLETKNMQELIRTTVGGDGGGEEDDDGGED